MDSHTLEVQLHKAIDFHRRGKLAEAEEAYRSILNIEPRHFDAAHLLGVVFRQRKQFEEAERQIARAIAINPGIAAAHSNRGNILMDLKRPDDALASYDRALELKPDYPEVLNNRGNTLQALGRLEEALASYDRAIALKRDYFEALNNRGNVLRDLKRADEAVTCFDQAIALKPDYATAYCNRGNALRDLRRSEDALVSFDKAIALKPDYGQAFSNRGRVLRDLNRIDESFVSYDKAFALDPELEYIEGARLHAKMHLCEWSNFDDDVARLLRHVREGKPAADPFALLPIPATPADQLLCAQILAADRYKPSSNPVWRGERYAHDKIRIGYVSGEFREQATAYLTADLFECHDRDGFALYAIATGWNDESPMRSRLEAAFDVFSNVYGVPDRAIAELIRRHEIDILVNLNGYFGAHRAGMFALRPSPVRVNYLGFPATIGAPYIDYIIADVHVIPEDDRRHYAEKVVYLPDTYQSNDRKKRIGEHAFTRAQMGLPERGFVFACFNNTYKLTPDMFAVWMRLLCQVDGSVLWLLEMNDAATRNILASAAERGIAARRIIFAPWMKPDAHLAREQLADLFLDTHPLNAHTTASDALWCGVPVLTCVGSTFGARVAASLLHAIGLPELTTESLADYEALALKLARDPAMLAAVKSKLARNRTTYPLFDTPRYTRHLEAAYRTMWQRHQNGEPPAAFSVPPIG